MRLSKDVFHAVLALVSSSIETTNSRDPNAKKAKNMELEFRYRNGVQTGIDRAAFQTLIKYFRSTPHKYREQQQSSLDISVVLPDETDHKRVSFIAPSNDANTVLNTLIARVSKSPESADIIISKQSYGKPIDYVDYDARIAWSKERVITADDARKSIITRIGSAKLYRFKRRFSFTIIGEPSKSSKQQSTDMRFDLTVVRQAARLDALLGAFETFEVELENNGAIDDPTSATAAIMAMFQQWSVLLKVIGDTDVVMSNSEKNTVQAQYAKLTRQGANDCKPLGPKLVTLEMHHLHDELVYSRYAITEKADGEHRLLFIDEAGSIFTIDDRMTIRFTGARSTNFKNCLLEAEFIATSSSILVFDVFYMNGTDVGGLPLMLVDEKKPGKSRASIVKSFAKDVNTSAVVTGVTMPAITAKDFIYVATKNDFFASTKTILGKKAAGNYAYGIDGIILTPADTSIGDGKYWGTWTKAFKWKPPQFNTIDFLVKIRHSEAEIRNNQLYKVADLYSAYSLPYTAPISSIMFISNTIPFNKTRQLVPQPFQPPDKADAYLAYIKVNDDGKLICEEGGEILDDTIVEFRYDVIQGSWHPLRLRDDKTEKYLKTGDIGGTANKFETALSVWRSIRTPITEDIITGRVAVPSPQPQLSTNGHDTVPEDDNLQMYYAIKSERRQESGTAGMRAFHNRWVKGEHLMFRFASKVSSIADFGCGRAGDLPKWKEMKAKKVLGLDLFADNLSNPRDGAHERALKHLRGTAPAFGVPKMAFLPVDLRKVFDASYINAMDDSHGDRTAAQILMAMIPTSAPRLKASSHLLKYHGFARTGFELVSCQFAVHYFFETRDTLRNFAQNLATFLQPGGYFVGTCLDAFKVDEALRDVRTGAFVQGVKNGAVVWQIMRLYEKLSQDNPIDNVGLKIRVFMESIGQAMVEYLVDINLLVATLAEVNIHPLSPEECAQVFGGGDTKKMSTGMFSDLFADMMQCNASSSRLGGDALALARNMDDVEKEYSFLNRWFVFRRSL